VNFVLHVINILMVSLTNSPSFKAHMYGAKKIVF
jgi:hypothetical protein